MDYDEELDTQGLVCPMPALKAKKALNKMNPGEVLKVITDYAPARESVPRDLAAGTKHELLLNEVDEDDDDLFNLYFKCVK